MLKKLSYVAALSFLLNLVWENLHSFLYAHYEGGPLSEYILLRATFGDMVIITLCAAFFLYIPGLRTRLWLMLPLGVGIAVIIERLALPLQHWGYTQYMPIIPYLGVGLTPTLQLALLGYCVFLVAL